MVDDANKEPRGTSRRRVSRYKTEYLYIHEYLYNKILVSWPINNHLFNDSSGIQVTYQHHPWQGLLEIIEQLGSKERRESHGYML